MQLQKTFGSLGSAATWIGVAAGAFILWKIRVAVLIGFGAILFAVMLTMLANLVCRLSRLNRAVGLVIATILVVGTIALCAALFGATLWEQLSNALHRIEGSSQKLALLLPKGGLSQSMIEHGTSLVGGIVPRLLSSAITLIEDAVIIAITAIYLAAQPAVYRRGVAALFPQRLRGRVAEALDLIGASLKLWVLGQLVLMMTVGILSYVAAEAIGLPNPIILGVIAGLTEVVPYLGPFIGAVPAVLTALSQSMATAEWTVAAYLGIHVFEGYLIEPLLHRWFVWIPPVLVLMSIIASQLIFGVAGVIFAAPIAVVVFAAVKVIYIGDTLGEPVEMPTHTPFTSETQ